MGRGDKRTMHGKIFRGSYGKARPHDPEAKKKDQQKEDQKSGKPQRTRAPG